MNKGWLDGKGHKGEGATVNGAACAVLHRVAKDTLEDGTKKETAYTMAYPISVDALKTFVTNAPDEGGSLEAPSIDIIYERLFGGLDLAYKAKVRERAGVVDFTIKVGEAKVDAFALPPERLARRLNAYFLNCQEAEAKPAAKWVAIAAEAVKKGLLRESNGTYKPVAHK